MTPKRRPKGTDLSKKRPHVNWQVDFDYLDTLDADSRAWLEQFAEEFYQSSSKNRLQTRPQVQERWRAYKANQRDLTTRTRVDPPEGLPEPSQDPEDAILNGVAARDAALDPLEEVEIAVRRAKRGGR